MEELQPRKTSGRRREMKPSFQNSYRLRTYDRDHVMMAAAAYLQNAQENSTFSSQRIIYYTLVFVKVVLWIIFAWILSHLHLGAPCFLLPVTFWLYSGPMQKAVNWAKRRLQGPVT